MCSSFLTICAEYVVVDTAAAVSDTRSVLFQLISRMPQGSVLGAFFYVLINDLCNPVNQCKVK
jgi:hypothetical protein